MKRLLAILLILIMTVSTFAACDEATLNGSVEADQQKEETKEENKDPAASESTPMLRINEKNNKWEISTDGGKTWKNTGVSATGKDGADGSAGANGEDGKDGENGKDGANGENGTDGNGILKIEVIDNNLWITYTNAPNAPINVGKITIDQYDLDFYPFVDGTYGVKIGNALRLEKIIIPPMYNGKPVTTILEDGFSNAQNLKEIILPETITSIEARAFKDCINLNNINLPDGITTISNEAFSCCTNLSNITIPNSVTSIGVGAFGGCGFTSITIPASVTYVGENAFASQIKKVYYDGTIASWCNIKFDTYGLDSMGYTNTNPLTEADEFYVKASSGEYELIQDLVIPEGVETIGDCAFFHYNGLRSVTLPSTLKTIGACAFACTDITSITFPNGVETVEELAFEYCSSLTEVRFDGSLEEWNAIYFHQNSSGDWHYSTSDPSKSYPYCSSRDFYTKNASGEYVLTTH